MPKSLEQLFRSLQTQNDVRTINLPDLSVEVNAIDGAGGNQVPVSVDFSASDYIPLSALGAPAVFDDAATIAIISPNIGGVANFRPPLSLNIPRYKYAYHFSPLTSVEKTPMWSRIPTAFTVPSDANALNARTFTIDIMNGFKVTMQVSMLIRAEQYLDNFNPQLAYEVLLTYMMCANQRERVSTRHISSWDVTVPAALDVPAGLVPVHNPTPRFGGNQDEPIGVRAAPDIAVGLCLTAAAAGNAFAGAAQDYDGPDYRYIFNYDERVAVVGGAANNNNGAFCFDGNPDRDTNLIFATTSDSLFINQLGAYDHLLIPPQLARQFADDDIPKFYAMYVMLFFPPITSCVIEPDFNTPGGRSIKPLFMWAGSLMRSMQPTNAVFFLPAIGTDQPATATGTYLVPPRTGPRAVRLCRAVAAAPGGAAPGSGAAGTTIAANTQLAAPLNAPYLVTSASAFIASWAGAISTGDWLAMLDMLLSWWGCASALDDALDALAEFTVSFPRELKVNLPHAPDDDADLQDRVMHYVDTDQTDRAGATAPHHVSGFHSRVGADGRLKSGYFRSVDVMYKPYFNKQLASCIASGVFKVVTRGPDSLTPGLVLKTSVDMSWYMCWYQLAKSVIIDAAVSSTGLPPACRMISHDSKYSGADSTAATPFAGAAAAVIAVEADRRLSQSQFKDFGDFLGARVRNGQVVTNLLLGLVAKARTAYVDVPFPVFFAETLKGFPNPGADNAIVELAPAGGGGGAAIEGTWLAFFYDTLANNGVPLVRNAFEYGLIPPIAHQGGGGATMTFPYSAAGKYPECVHAAFGRHFSSFDPFISGTALPWPVEPELRPENSAQLSCRLWATCPSAKNYSDDGDFTLSSDFNFLLERAIKLWAQVPNFPAFTLTNERSTHVFMSYNADTGDRPAVRSGNLFAYRLRGFPAGAQWANLGDFFASARLPTIDEQLAWIYAYYSTADMLGFIRLRDIHTRRPLGLTFVSRARSVVLRTVAARDRRMVRVSELASLPVTLPSTVTTNEEADKAALEPEPAMPPAPPVAATSIDDSPDDSHTAATDGQ